MSEFWSRVLTSQPCGDHPKVSMIVSFYEKEVEEWIPVVALIHGLGFREQFSKAGSQQTRVGIQLCACQTEPESLESCFRGLSIATKISSSRKPKG